jgi:hypothetical protein
MGVTTKKYGVLISFCRKSAIFDKTIGNLWILRENLTFLEIHKNSYTRPLCISSQEYGGHDQEIQSFD